MNSFFLVCLLRTSAALGLYYGTLLRDKWSDRGAVGSQMARMQGQIVLFCVSTVLCHWVACHCFLDSSS